MTTGRNYKLQDIKDFVFAEYELDWKGFKVLDDNRVRTVRAMDFDGDRLSVAALVFKNERKVLPRLIVATNEYISVSGHGARIDDWQEFLALRHKFVQGLNN